MTIGTSMGLAFESDMHQQAGIVMPPPTPDDNIVTPGQVQQNKELDQVEQTELGGTPISFQGDFRPAGNIEDRRDTPYTLSDQWNSGEFSNTLKGIAGAFGFDQHATPPEGEMTDLGRQLGLNDVKLDPNFKPQNTLLDHLQQKLGLENHATGMVYEGLKSYFRGYDKDYNTNLSSKEEEDFVNWKAKNAPNDAGTDYDLKGAFKAGLSPAENGHFPDTFKKPWHPTFSDESKYHGVDGNVGGHRSNDEEGNDLFTPGKTNFDHFTPDQMKDYFKNVEDAKTKLSLPDIPPYRDSVRRDIKDIITPITPPDK